MQVLTDGGVALTPDQMNGQDVTVIQHKVTIYGKTYTNNVDINTDEILTIMQETGALASTSLPSPGEFADGYRKLLDHDTDILSLHVSTGLSNTLEAATVAAGMVPEAKIKLVNTLTISAPMGWQVEAAVKASAAGWGIERTVELLETIHSKTRMLCTVPDLKYLVNSGRLSHLKTLLVSVLKIKPVITVDRKTGKFALQAICRTLKKAMRKIVAGVLADYPAGTRLRTQMLHAGNPQGAAQLKGMMTARFDCTWLPAVDVPPVQAAHVGPGFVGVVFAALDDYPLVV